MDRRRKCALIKLKTLLNLLDDEENQTCGDIETMKELGAICLEKYPTCPAMAKKYVSKEDNIPFESTLRKTNYPLAPYRGKRLENFSYIPCPTDAILKSVEPHKINFKTSSMNQRTHFVNKRQPYTQRKSPKLYIVKQDSFHDHSSDCSKPMRPSFFRKFQHLRGIQQNVIPPPKCCQSKELRGGFMYYGCDCNKTNGLQDRCLRFCCLRNPKCKTRPAACYLSRFSGGKHLPDISTRERTAPTYVDFNEEGSDCADFEFAETEDHEGIQPSYQEDRRNCLPCDNYEVDYEQPQKIRCIPFQRRYLIPQDYSLQDDASFSCCRREPRVLKIPQVVYESSHGSYRFEPTKLCVCCPLSYIESPELVYEE